MSDRLATKIAAIVLTSEDATVIAESLDELGYTARSVELDDYKATRAELIRCFKAGKKSERAAIVAWLRRQAHANGVTDAAKFVLLGAAGGIELEDGV